MTAPVCAVALVLLLALEGKRHRLGALVGGMSYPLYLNAWIAVFAINMVFKHMAVSTDYRSEGIDPRVQPCYSRVLYKQVDRRILDRRQ